MNKNINYIVFLLMISAFYKIFCSTVEIAVPNFKEESIQLNLIVSFTIGSTFDQNETITTNQTSIPFTLNNNKKKSISIRSIYNHNVSIPKGYNQLTIIYQIGNKPPISVQSSFFIKFFNLTKQINISLGDFSKTINGNNITCDIYNESIIDQQTTQEKPISSQQNLNRGFGGNGGIV